MPKRKREEVADDQRPPPTTTNDSSQPPLSAKQQRAQFKLQQNHTKLSQAFKLAKGFERQKLGRRSKNALVENRNTDAKRIADEIAALKELDAGLCAKHLLHKTLGKIKAVAESERLPPAWSGLPGALMVGDEVASSEALNVFGRLCNANPVKAALPEIMAEVQKMLGLAVVETEKRGEKKKRLRAKDYAELAAGELEQAEEPAKVGDEQESEDEFLGFDDRVASSANEDSDGGHSWDSQDEDDDDNEDLDIDDLERQLENEGVSRRDPGTKGSKQQRYDHDRVPSLSPSASSSRSSTPEPKRVRKPRAVPEPAPRASAFIPSLTLGGYVSGSDGSDIEEIDDFVAPPKKNRRGQRARQQIWEKKFGQKAKHVVNPKTNENVNGFTGNKRADGWDMKRGATDGGRRGGRFDGGGRGGRGGRSEGGRGGRAAGAAGEKPAAKLKHKDDQGPIHPSWEAAKKAKQVREAPVTFTGKKTTFD